MSYTYLPEPGAESSAECYSDTPQFALWKLNPTAERSYSKGSETESCQGSQSGTTLKLSTASLGADVLTSFAEDSPAKILVQPGKAPESEASVADCGQLWHVSLAKLDLDSCLWKIPQGLLFADLESSLEIWPRWGMMRDGECFPLATLAHVTSASDCGLLPTPKKSDAFQARMKMENFKRPEGKEHNFGMSNCDEYLSNLYQKRYTPKLGETLMLWPYGWTDLARLEMAKFHKWRLSHSEL